MAENKGLTLKEWRELRKPVSEILPSGLAVELKKVSVESIALSGTLPMDLLTEINAQSNGSGELEITDILANLSDYMDMINGVVIACVVSPLIMPKPSAKYLGIDEVELNDKLYILKWALQEVDALESFRKE